jgi:isopentenyldiphosphate isomerase
MSELWDLLDESGNKTGRFHKRDVPMKAGEAHLTVSVWITNSKGEFLISKRAANVEWQGGMWHSPGGCAVAGDDGLAASVREAKEELGIELLPENGRLYKKNKQPHIFDDGTVIDEAWIFTQEIDINSITLQLDEISDVMWASKEKIRAMIGEGTFVSPKDAYPYIEELFTQLTLLQDG